MSLTTAELLKIWDQRRPRTMQTELGMSDLGGCERRAKYRLLGTEPSDESGSIQAVLGTLIHEAIAEVLKELQEQGLIPAEDLIESEVHFADVPGHNDHYEADTETLVDTKSTSQRYLDSVLDNGISQSWKFQTATYAAALMKKKLSVKWIRIDVIARDTGNEESFLRPFDTAEVDEAMKWLAHVRRTDLEDLERGYAPDSPFCRGCPFRTLCWGGAVPERDERSVLYVENPDAKYWMQELLDARADKAAAERRADFAKGALDALRPNNSGKQIVDIGLPDKDIAFTVVHSDRLDSDQVKADYRAVGAEPPTKTSKQVRVTFPSKKTPKRTVS